ncbi:MAG: bifunctional riboflavin kinase/FAD synthetase [Candidatus Omnitrophota bacterium]|nr:MAG: bifunctional riboflavin kinase/FAD synthetase [Candidatus Omnitrophota bacterium]
MKKQYVATIGVFDGVHLGHKFIFETVKRIARQYRIPSLVITFNIPPKKLLSNKFYGYLTYPEEKINIIKSLRITRIWVLKTSLSLLNFSGEQFIEYILNHFSIHTLIVGEDFRFGKDGKCDARYLKKLSRRYDFTLIVIEKKKKQGMVISSTRIRELIKSAQFKKAKILLGRDYVLSGKVVPGHGWGKKLGFPTVNIAPSHYVVPPKGVYAGWAIIERKTYPCAFNLGTRPTVSKSKKLVLEGHLIGFRKNVLGKTIRVVFSHKIRIEQKFSSLQKLRTAIQSDVTYIQRKYSQKLKNFSYF